jgi:hypothetical protein
MTKHEKWVCARWFGAIFGISATAGFLIHLGVSTIRRIPASTSVVVSSGMGLAICIFLSVIYGFILVANFTDNETP